MQALLETTVWDAGFKVPNHTYLMEGASAIGYIPAGKTEPQMFRSPMKLDKRRRTFVEVKVGIKVKSNVRTVRVAGSKGAEYVVTLGRKSSCSCPAYTFRGNCKHIAIAEAQV